jgi:hypothetical protein
VSEYEYDLEISGYTGRCIDDHVFKTIEEAENYIKTEYPADYDGLIELYKRDIDTGIREQCRESDEPGTWWVKVYGSPASEL